MENTRRIHPDVGLGLTTIHPLGVFPSGSRGPSGGRFWYTIIRVRAQGRLAILSLLAPKANGSSSSGGRLSRNLLNERRHCGSFNLRQHDRQCVCVRGRIPLGALLKNLFVRRCSSPQSATWAHTCFGKFWLPSPRGGLNLIHDQT